MKKTLRFAALAAATTLTWMTMEDQAQAYVSCSTIRGTSCTGSPTRMYCGPNNIAICGCFYGVWQCGCEAPGAC